MTNILLVEDEPSFGGVLQNYIELSGYRVTLAPDGKKGLETFTQLKFDLCLLDVMMPEMDGFELARKIREINTQIPIIFITAKTMKQDVIEGFKSGADDYVTKPFDSEVLLYKIKALLNRCASGEQKIAETIHEFEIGLFSFDSNLRVLKLNDSETKLSPKEGKLLEMLCLDKGELLTRDKALLSIWGDNDYFSSRSMDVYIAKLRKYLKGDPDIQIENIHGSGFRLLSK